MKYGKDVKELQAQADAIEAMNVMDDGGLSAQAAALDREANYLKNRRGGLLVGSVYLIIFGVLIAGASVGALSKAIKSKRQLDGLALGPTRLKWNGGAGVTLRF